MSTQQGQTDQVLKIQLASQLLMARWLDAEVAANGEAGLEANTLFVGHGAPVKVTVKDAQGGAAGNLEGKVLQNFFRARFKPDAKAAGKVLYFEAELPKHSLKKASGGLKVFPAVEFSALRFTDEKGAALTEIPEGKTTVCEAKVKGLEEGYPVNVSVTMRLRKDDPVGITAIEAETPVEGGKVKLLIDPRIKVALDKIRIQLELDKEGGKYHQPDFLFSCRARGVTAVSEPAKAVQTLTLRFQETPGAAGTLEGKKVTIVAPDGKKEEKSIPKDGKIVITKSVPGRYKLAGDLIKTLRPAPTKHPPGEVKSEPLTEAEKKKLVNLITLLEGGKGEAAYWAMNLDYEFEGRWDLPKKWYKADKDGKKTAKPDSIDPSVPYSKYSGNPRHVGLSYGIIQFTQEGPLGALLKLMKGKNGGKFKEVFGEHADELATVTGKSGDFESHDEEVFDNTGHSMGTKKVRRRPSVNPVGGHELWHGYWTERFKQAGKVKDFQECQDELAVKNYLDPVVKQLKDKSVKTVSEKCLALLYDRSVNNGAGAAQKLARNLADEGDEQAFWEKAVKKYKGSVLKRVQHLLDSDKVSWDKYYEL